MRGLLEEVRARGVSVLLNSHLLSEVELVCDRVVILLGGKVVAEGATHELAHPRGIEIETGEGARLFPGAKREDAPRLVAEPSPPGRRSTASASSARRSRRSTSRPSRERRHDRRSIVGYAIGEAVRRKVVARGARPDGVFLGLDALANHYIFSDLASFHVPADAEVDKRTFAGSFVVGMSMFATLFLGVVLAVFLTLGAVSGDAERGLLQPLVVRPIGRRTMLLARFVAAAGVCAVVRVRRLLSSPSRSRAPRAPGGRTQSCCPGSCSPARSC